MKTLTKLKLGVVDNWKLRIAFSFVVGHVSSYIFFITHTKFKINLKLFYNNLKFNNLKIF